MEFNSKRRNLNNSSIPACQGRENIKNLINLASGYNLKSNSKISYTAILCDPISEVLFQYMAVSPEDEVGVPSLHTINLNYLKGNTASAQEIVKDILTKIKLPQELVPQLWHKVRLAKGMNNREAKFQTILSSILALKIILLEVREPTHLMSIISEIELKTTLLPDLIQLLRCPKAPMQLQKEALEICCILLNRQTRYRMALREVGGELEDEVKHLLDINFSTNGLALKMMRDCTGLRLDESIHLIMPVGGLEVLSFETAAHPEFLAALLNLLATGLKQTSKQEYNHSFWNGVKACIMNMLQLPMARKVYHFRLSVTDLAMGILTHSSMHQSTSQDVSDINRILSRLNFELELLEKKTEVIYPDLPTYTQYSKEAKIKDRQQLINSLINLLANTIDENRRRDPIFQDEDDMDEDIRMSERFRSLLHGPNPFSLRPRMAEREEDEPIIREARRRFGREENAIRQQQEPEPEAVVTVAVSRRILESRLLDIILNASRNVSKFLTVEQYAPVIYSILYLIQSVIKDIPSCTTEFTNKGIIQNLIMNLSGNIYPSPNYLKYSLSFLSAIQLNEKAKTLVKTSEILRKLLNTMTLPGYQKCFKYTDEGYNVKDEAEAILEIYTHDESIRREIVQSIQNNFHALKEMTVRLISNYNLYLNPQKEATSSGRKDHEDQLKIKKEKIKNHRKTISILLNLVSAWVQLRNRHSRDWEKFLINLNSGNVFLKVLLLLSKLYGFLKVINKTETKKTWAMMDLSKIFRFYCGEENPFRSQYEQSAKEIITGLEQVKHYFENGLKFGSVPLIEYIYCLATREVFMQHNYFLSMNTSNKDKWINEGINK